MALLDIFGLNSILNLIIIAVEFALLIGFLVIYVKNKANILKPLIWSIFLLTLSNIFGLLYLITAGNFVGDLILGLFSYILVGGAIIFLAMYLESFERDEPYSLRSSLTIFLLSLTGILQIVGLFSPDRLLFLALFTPIPYTIVGILYIRYIRRIGERARVEAQKKKIRKVQFGTFVLFLAPVEIYVLFPIATVMLVFLHPPAIEELLVVSDQRFNIGSLDPIVIFCQLIGILLISIPILRSQSTHFMQSRRISRIMVITDSGIPIFDFNLTPEHEGKELLFSGAITAIKSVMSEATGANELQSIVFGDLHILTEVKDGYAVNLLVEHSSAILKESLKIFAQDYEALFPKTRTGIIDEEANNEAIKLVQLHFGIETEELEQIMKLRDQAFTKPSPVGI